MLPQSRFNLISGDLHQHRLTYVALSERRSLSVLAEGRLRLGHRPVESRFWEQVRASDLILLLVICDSPRLIAATVIGRDVCAEDRTSGSIAAPFHVLVEPLAIGLLSEIPKRLFRIESFSLDLPEREFRSLWEMCSPLDEVASAGNHN